MGPETLPAGSARAAHAALHARQGTGWTLEVVSVSVPRTRAVLRARRGDDRLVLKTFGGPKAARREADALHEFGAAGVPTVGIRWLDGPRGVLCLEDLGERSEEDALEGDGRPEALARIGAWLPRFLAAARPERAPYDPGPDLARLDAALAELGPRAEPLRPYRAAFGAGAARLHGREVATIALHGDLKPQNLMCSPAGPVVIDRSEMRRGLGAFDAAHLAQAVSMLALRARRRGAPWSERPPDLRRAVLDPARAAGLIDPVALRHATWQAALWRWAQALRIDPEGWRARSFADRCARLMALDAP